MGSYQPLVTFYARAGRYEQIIPMPKEVLKTAGAARGYSKKTSV
jgi:hypothetical protein